MDADLARLIPESEPLRRLRPVVDEVLRRRVRIPPAHVDDPDGFAGRAGMLVRARLLQILEGTRSPRRLVEVANYNLLHRWFIGLPAGLAIERELAALEADLALPPEDLPVATLVADILTARPVQDEMHRQGLRPDQALLQEALAERRRARRARWLGPLLAPGRWLASRYAALRPAPQASPQAAAMAGPGPASPPPSSRPPGASEARPAAPRRPLPFWLRRTFRVAGVAAALLALAGLGLDAGLPSTAEMQALLGRPQILVALDGEGSVVEVERILPIPVAVDSLPEHLIRAVVEMEDRRFFRHFGFDPFGLGRAVLERIHARLGGPPARSGGSTITQQVARNIFLDQEDSILRKLRELLVALKLEAILDKRAILELYLNHVYLGRDVRGIEQAARHYFGVRANQLDPYQSAMLVGLFPSPGRFAPTANLALAHGRARLVLDTLVGRGALPAAERDRLLAARAGLPLARLQGGERSAARLETRYFRDWIQPGLQAMGLPPGRQYRVVLTLDPLAQLYAEHAVRNLLREGAGQGIDDGALLALAPDGAVRAMVGGRSYGERQFNRTTQDLLAPASTFKLFVYLAALEAGLGPDSELDDSPIATKEGPYPRNFDGRFRGRVAMREALAQSLNAAAVQTGQSLGPERVIAMARRLGVASALEPQPSLPLGTQALRMIELAAAYAVLPHGGLSVTPYGILAVQSADGRLVHLHAPPTPQRLLAPAHVAAMNGMLREVIRSGTGRGAAWRVQAAGKTGTGDQFREAWFVGYTGDLTAALWAGNSLRRPMREVSGGGLPARYWRNFMANVYQDTALPPLPGVRE